MARTSEQKELDYKSMNDSTSVINSIINGSKFSKRSSEEKKERVKKNYVFLEQLVALDDWGSEDMTAFNKAIIDGKAYVG